MTQDIPPNTEQTIRPGTPPKRDIGGGPARRLVIVLAFALIVASLSLLAFSVGSEPGPDGTLRLVDKSLHNWAMSLAAVGIALFAIAMFGVLWLIRMIFVFAGLALGFLAANALSLDSAILRWISILGIGLLGWGAGVFVTSWIARLFGRQ